MPNVRQSRGVVNSAAIRSEDASGRRFCSDACRTRFSRERKDRELRDIATRLNRLAGTRVEPLDPSDPNDERSIGKHRQ